MNLFEKAKRNAILKIQYKNLNGFDIPRFIRELDKQHQEKDYKTFKTKTECHTSNPNNSK